MSGRFAWYDLMTTDLAKSKAFYSELFGWRMAEQDMGEMGKYTMIHVGEAGIGGMVSLDAGAGPPSHWIAYVTVDDVDAACTKVESLGGKVHVKPFDIPNVGRSAVIEDPSGGYMSPFKFAGAEPPEAEPGTGHIVWNELLSTDVEKAKAFLPEIFGYDLESMDMGPAGTYWMMKRGDKPTAGLMQMPAEAQAPTHWAFYVGVDDVDETATRAEKLGAKIMVPPRDIPNIGRFTTMLDPTGAPISAYKSASQG